jgi:hypothetical protein
MIESKQSPNHVPPTAVSYQSSNVGAVKATNNIPAINGPNKTAQRIPEEQKKSLISTNPMDDDLDNLL